MLVNSMILEQSHHIIDHIIQLQLVGLILSVNLYMFQWTAL